MEDIKVNQEYWFVNEHILSESPKKVTVIALSGRVANFDTFVGKETYGELSMMTNSLFETKEEAYVQFFRVLGDGRFHFVDLTDKKFADVISFIKDENRYDLLVSI